MEHYQAIINSPLGKLGICTTAAALSHIRYLEAWTPTLKPQNDLAQRVVAELEHYFQNPQHRFTVPITLNVSTHQAAVLAALQAIPSGMTQSYGQVAQNIQSGPRAVGNACRRNPIAIVIPCHRIVAAKHLGGYNGARTGKMLEIKQWLLAHESSTKDTG